jgi:hypothetical protein
VYKKERGHRRKTLQEKTCTGTPQPRSRSHDDDGCRRRPRLVYVARVGGAFLRPALLEPNQREGRRYRRHLAGIAAAAVGAGEEQGAKEPWYFQYPAVEGGGGEAAGVHDVPGAAGGG